MKEKEGPKDIDVYLLDESDIPGASLTGKFSALRTKRNPT